MVSDSHHWLLVVLGELLVPLFANVIFLFGGRIPSLICGKSLFCVPVLVSLVSAAGDSVAEASVVAVGVAVSLLLTRVGACGIL